MGDHASLTVRVSKQIEEGILSGKYPVGSWLTEQELSGDCQVSRTPIRAALQRLEQEGLVELLPNKGARVLGISSQDLEDIYRMRMRLEGLSAAMAATRLTQADAKKMLEILELSEFYIARGDADKLRDLDSDFHKAVYLACGSRMLGQTLWELHRKIGVWRAKSLTSSTRGTESAAEHRAIYEALLAGDAALADTLTAQHVERAMNHLLSLD